MKATVNRQGPSLFSAGRGNTPPATQTARNPMLALQKPAPRAPERERRSSHERAGNTPLVAIRNRCLDCCCWRPEEVKLCTSTDCALHPWRFGRRPSTMGIELVQAEPKPKRPMTEAQRAGLTKAHAARKAKKEAMNA